MHAHERDRGLHLPALPLMGETDQGQSSSEEREEAGQREGGNSGDEESTLALYEHGATKMPRDVDYGK